MSHPSEGADDEGIVAVVAVEAQLGLVTVDLERIVAATAVNDHREADAATQLAARVSMVRRSSSGATSAGSRGRAEDLADLEGIVARAAIERGDGAVVVAGEVVVAAQAR